MSTVSTTNNFQAAQEAIAKKVEGRLHCYIKETYQGRPTVSCIWNETPENTYKEVVFVGEQGFEALTVVRVANKSMKASVHVAQMLIDLFQAQYKRPVGEDVEF
uniref:Uncharacterized protein n=1 Tax=Pseudomonas fluorescens (strain SBW25) TaxID=216595 RepID=A0A0G4E4L7_PSEFS|nr:hypothetical protein [Pseudomonas fluorescens]CEK42181.1 hypothetical protein PQBR57_0228 [Pseudomonas fluorescens SBW25]